MLRKILKNFITNFRLEFADWGQIGHRRDWQQKMVESKTTRLAKQGRQTHDLKN